jgi:hypothetical protein
MGSIRLASVIALALSLAGCAHAARPPLATRAALDEVGLLASTKGAPTDVARQARHGAKIAGHTALGALGGLWFPFRVCSFGGYLGKFGVFGVYACGIGLFVLGGPELIVGVLAASTGVGAAVGGNRGMASTRPAREAGAAAEALLAHRAPPATSIAGWLVEGAVAGTGESGFHLTQTVGSGADARAGGATVRVEVTSLVLEPDDSGLFFALRVDARATLVVGGQEVGRGEATVRTSEELAVATVRTPDELAVIDWDGPEKNGAPLRAAIAAAVRDAAAAATADLLLPLGRSHRAVYSEEDVCGLGPTTPDGQAVNGFSAGEVPLHVSPTDRTLKWEPWFAGSDEQLPDAVVTYELRVWNVGSEVVVDAKNLPSPTYELGPELVERYPYPWSVRAVVTSRGKRFATPWSRYGAGVGCGRPAPDADSRFRVIITPDAPPGPSVPTWEGDPSF